MISSKIEQQNLQRYLVEPERLSRFWVFNHKTWNPDRCVAVEHYTLNSQTWPKGPEINEERAIWQHTLVLYRPDLIKTRQALLFVNGGTRHINAQEDNPEPHELDFVRLAAETNSLVVDLQDVPNQYLTFSDAVSRKGDSILAYSWNQFMNDHKKNAYWPLSLPMTKSVIKAMDAIQHIMIQEYFIQIEQFVVAGLSKRGLATWLAALHDERINSIVPIVIDTLNTKIMMNHIYASYDNNWPPAFHEFIQEKITDRLSSKEFEQLMEIEDPLAYLHNDPSDFYKKRLSIPKYIISASGDDFFTPDCLNLYLGQLPGENRVRFVPNQGHLIDMNIIEDALLAYYRAFINRVHLPIIKWNATPSGRISQVLSDKPPLSVKLWEAENSKNRDFRLAAQIHYLGRDIRGIYRDGFYQYPIQVKLPSRGWKAYFVELTYQESQGGTLIMTTPAYVIPLPGTRNARVD